MDEFRSVRTRTVSVFEDPGEGERFGQLTVIGPSRDKIVRVRMVPVLCDCGRRRELRLTKLMNGQQSCGCLVGRTTAARNRSHGQSDTRLYSTWRGMRQRCGNPNVRAYPQYGGRGITVCAEWQDSFEAFWAWAEQNGYAEDLEIDRVDVDGHYEPGNCRWIPRFRQGANKQNTRYVAAFGRTLHLAEWTRQPEWGGAPESVIGTRLTRGVDPEVAIATRVMEKSNQFKVTIDDEEMPAAEALLLPIAASGLSYKVFWRRVNDGWSHRDALTTLPGEGMKRPRLGRQGEPIELWGEAKPLLSWARDERSVVSEDTVLQRVRTLGWELERALTTPARATTTRHRMLSALGETKPMVEWASDPRCVVSYNALNRRISVLGWDPERAITEPSHLEKSRCPA